MFFSSCRSDLAANIYEGPTEEEVEEDQLGRDKHHSPVTRIIYSIVVIANGAIWRPSLVAGWGRQWMNAKLQGHIVPSQSLQAESIPSLCFCTESSPSFGMLHGARFSFPSLGRRTNTPWCTVPNQANPHAFLLAAPAACPVFCSGAALRVCTAPFCDKTHCKPDQKLGAPFTPDCWQFPSFFLGNPEKGSVVLAAHVRSATDGWNDITSHPGQLGPHV